MAKEQQKTGGARRAAVSALVHVHRGGYANLSAGALAAPALSARDRAFAGAIFFGSVERLVTLDWLLCPFLKRPLEKLDVEVRAILECGLYQLLYMRVPQSAAVNESVRLARSFGKSSAAGFVNAVLRRAAALPVIQQADENMSQGPLLDPCTFENEQQRVSVQYSVSLPVAEAVIQALPNEYDAFLAHSFSQKETCLRVNTLQTSLEALETQLQARGISTRRSSLPQGLYARFSGSPAEDEAFQKGLFHVQGEASQYACACLQVQKGDTVLDLCAAPGGKSATLAQQLGTGAGLTACDVRPARLDLVKKAFARLGIQGAAFRCGDASVYEPALPMAERVLCDVPCSGLGVLAKKPDLRFTQGENFTALPKLQLKILRTASRYVKRGGRLVYSTCTIRPQENQQVVQAFLQQETGFAWCAPPCVPQGALQQNGMVTILPHRTGLDGFFVATMERL